MSKGSAVHILVTGGSGFIGRYFVRQLREQGHRVTILDLWEPDFDTMGARYIWGDVRDPAAVRRALPGVDRVLNLAAAHHDFGIDADTYFSVNETGSRVLLDACDEFGIREVAFYSTCAVYGAAQGPHDESAEPSPLTAYGASKLAGEKVHREWIARGMGRRVLVIRPTVTFGADNFANMFSLIRQIESGKFVTVGDGSNIKSLSYVENIVDATLFLWAKDDRAAFDVFNYTDTPDMTSQEIADTIRIALGRKPSKVRIPLGLACGLAAPFDLFIKLTGKNLPISSARIRKLFATQTKFEGVKVREAGYVAKVPLAEGIRRMVAWYLAEGKARKAVWRIPPLAVQTRGVETVTLPASPAKAPAPALVSAA